MNTFFLSLLQPEIKREKKRSTIYQVENDVRNKNKSFLTDDQFQKYIISRFPFISRGDTLIYRCMILFFGYSLIGMEVPQVDYPFFYEDINKPLSFFSKGTLERISNCKTERRKTEFKVGNVLFSQRFLVTTNFKIHKTKFDLFFFGREEDEFLELEECLQEKRYFISHNKRIDPNFNPKVVWKKVVNVFFYY